MTGDDRAFHELVLRRQGKVRDLLRRLCRNHALADDLAQQAFLKAWKSLPSLREPEAFGGWLRSIALNVWREEARRGGVILEADDGRLDETPDPVSRHAGVEARMDLEEALNRLSAGERLCLVLSHAEGMSHGEIAAAAELPVGTVKSHIARGGEKIRRWLAIGEGDD